MTLTVNFVITAIAFLSIIVLFFGVQPWIAGAVLLHKDLLTDLPYGWIGVHRRAAFRHLVLSRHRGHLPGGRGSALAGPRAAARHHDAA